MAVPTIEQFIERSKVNCRASAALTVKRRYMTAHSEDGDEETVRARANAYIGTPEGEAQVEKALNSEKFYKLLCSENAAEQPRVVNAYKRHISGMTVPSAADMAERRRTKNKRKKENKKRKTKIE